MSLLMTTLAVVTAQAAPPPSSADDTITVTARRTTQDEVRDFVDALTPRSRVGGLRRFEDEAVCPLVVGLRPTQNAAMIERMRRVTASVEVPVGKAGCTPNVILAVTDSKRHFMTELLRSKPDYFGDIPSSRVRQLIASPGPAAGWQTDGVPLNARGQRLVEDPDMGWTNRTTDPASRLRTQGRLQFETSVVVVERSALDGLTTTQLADYAIVRGLTGADPAALAGSNAPTILRVLDAASDSLVPVTLTTWDQSFLRGYYKASPTLSIAQQQGQIRKAVSQQVGAPPPR